MVDDSYRASNSASSYRELPYFSVSCFLFPSLATAGVSARGGDPGRVRPRSDVVLPPAARPRHGQAAHNRHGGAGHPQPGT